MGSKSLAQKIIDKIRRKRAGRCGNIVTNQWFYECLKKFKEKDLDQRFGIIKEEDFYPCLDDCTSKTGFDAHYTYHPAWALRILAQTKPEVHVDISSSLNFCTTLSAFIPTEFYDYRPAQLNLSNLKCGRADLCKLHFDDNSIKSLSCMHVVEHIGLGRYGDEIDPDGDLKSISELKRVLAVGGDLLFAVPIAQKPKIQFNGNRVYSYDMIMDYFKGYELKNFALINDDGDFLESAKEKDVQGKFYSCGCFWFKKNN